MSSQELSPIKVRLRSLRVIRNGRASGEAITSLLLIRQSFIRIQQLIFGIVKAEKVPGSTQFRVVIPWHGELDTSTFLQRVVGQTLQFTVLLRVHPEEPQVPLVLEVAHPSADFVTLQHIRSGDHVGLHRDYHLLIHGQAKVLLRETRNLSRDMQL